MHIKLGNTPKWDLQVIAIVNNNEMISMLGHIQAYKGEGQLPPRKIEAGQIMNRM
jgi:hypothetical protein